MRCQAPCSVDCLLMPLPTQLAELLNMDPNRPQILMLYSHVETNLSQILFVLVLIVRLHTNVRSIWVLCVKQTVFVFVFVCILCLCFFVCFGIRNRFANKSVFFIDFRFCVRFQGNEEKKNWKKIWRWS